MHNVGDIVYIVSNKKRQVLPAQVIEQINRKTLAGEQIQYQVLIAGASSPVDLDSLSAVGKVFSSLEDVRSSLYKQAELAIVQVLEDASNLASIHFAVDDEEELEPTSDPVDNPTTHESGETAVPKAKRVKVKLPDGTSASVSMPVV